MNTYIKSLFVLLFAVVGITACEKDIDQTMMTDSVPPTVALSPASVILTAAEAADTVEVISWSASDYGYSAATNYTVEIAKAGAGFAGSQLVNTGSKRELKYLGAVLNDLAIGQGIAPGSSGDLEVRIKSAVSDSLFIYSPTSTLTVKTYQVEYPALLVKGGNGWVTPATRTNGFLLTSPDFSSQYEGYLNLPNADGWGGDALKLVSTSSGLEYGWGSSATTMSVGGGNLWFTPAPNFMKVNADISALTVNFTPVQFHVTGDHNSWNTSATPMSYDPVSKRLIATNVSLTAGKSFVFTANGGYDLSYKVNADNKIIYSGPPAWAGTNIPVPATGVYTVILDLSGGNGSYTYSIQ